MEKFKHDNKFEKEKKRQATYRHNKFVYWTRMLNQNWVVLGKRASEHTDRDLSIDSFLSFNSWTLPAHSSDSSSKQQQQQVHYTITTSYERIYESSLVNLILAYATSAQSHFWNFGQASKSWNWNWIDNNNNNKYKSPHLSRRPKLCLANQANQVKPMDFAWKLAAKKVEASKLSLLVAIAILLAVSVQWAHLIAHLPCWWSSWSQVCIQIMYIFIYTNKQTDRQTNAYKWLANILMNVCC